MAEAINSEQLLTRLLQQMQILDHKLDEVSLNQQRDGVRIGLLESSRHVDQVDGYYRQSSSQAVSGPQVSASDDNPLLTLAGVACAPQNCHNQTNSDIETFEVKTQAESVRDKVKAVPLPAHLLLPTTQGIKVSDRKRVAVIRSSAGYTTTCLKLIKQWGTKQVQDTDIQDLFHVLCAHMRQLQMDLNECVMESHAPKMTIDYFRYLSSNDTTLSTKDQQNFETACNWTVATQRATEADSRRSGRPAYRGRSSFRGAYRSSRGRYNSVDDILNGLDQSLPIQKES